MKSFFKSLVLASLFLSFSYSCSEDASSDDGGVPAEGEISATIAGKSWTGTNGSGMILQTSSVKTLTVAGGKKTTPKETISIVIYGGQDGSLTIGDYPITTQSFVSNAQITYNAAVGTADNIWRGTIGTVTLSKMTDTNYQGTFSGTLTKDNSTETKTITNGGFNVDKLSF